MTNKLKFNTAFNRVYQQNKLTLGVNFPIESYTSPVPEMKNQIALAQQVEAGGFAAIWSRDIPVYDPTFGDTGQIYDPWVWLGFIAAQTSTIALGTGSIILPLRPSVDLAKAAASVDQLSSGRLIMGVASGDRPVEYSIYNTDFDSRGQLFRNTFEFIKKATHQPKHWSNQNVVNTDTIDILPKSYANGIPLLVTGNSRQELQWIAKHADGWLMYPRPINQQATVVNNWRSTYLQEGYEWKPFSQSLYIDLVEDANAPPVPIHLGYKLGRNAFINHLKTLCGIGVNHVSVNLRFSSRPIEQVIDEICDFVLPQFPPN